MMAIKDSQVSILLVDDDAQMCETYAELLAEEGYKVDTSGNAEEALNFVQMDRKSYQVALIDQVLAGKMDGIELMRNLRASLPKLEVILFTGWGSSSEAEGLQAGAFRFLQKPIDPVVLLQLVKVCADAWQAREELDIAQRQSKILETLRDYSQKITSSLDRDYILDQTCLCLGQLMNVENLTIALLNLRRDKLECVRSYNEGKIEHVLPLPFSMLEGQPGLMSWIVRHKAPLLVRDLFQDIPPVQSIQWGEGKECSSFLGAPLLSQDQPIGAIAVQDPMIGCFDSTDQRTLMAVANQAAQALYNANLFNELHVLDRISRMIMQPDDIFTMLDAILEPLGELIDTDNLRIGLLRPQRNEIDLLIRNDCSDRLPRLVLPVYKCLIGYTVLCGESVWLHTLSDVQDLKTSHHLGTYIGKEPHCWLSTPLVTDQGVIGAIAIQDFERENVYNEHDSELLIRLANHIAVGIKKAQIFERLQLISRQREALYQASLYILKTDPYASDKIWWTFLNAVTASYGLGFNRAMLLRKEITKSEPAGEVWLVGWMGMGDLDKDRASDTWTRMELLGNASQEAFYNLPPKEYNHTPVHLALQGMRIPIKIESSDVFSKAVYASQAAVAYSDQLPSDISEVIRCFGLQEFAIVPLKMGEDIDYVLVVDNRFTHQPIDTGLLDSLNEFCRGVETVISNRILQRELERQYKVLNRHYQISTALRTIPNTDEILRLVMDAMVEIYKLDTCTFGEYDPVNEQLVFRQEHQTGLPYPIALSAKNIPLEFWRAIIENDQPLVFADLKSHPDIRSLLVHKDLNSFIFLPVKEINGKLLGIFTMGRFGPLTVQPSDLQSLKTLTGQVALAMQNARLFTETKRRNKTQMLLLEIASNLTSLMIRGEKELYQTIAISAQELTGADSVSLYPFRPGTRYYDIDRIATIGHQSEEKIPDAAKDRKLLRSMTGQVIKYSMVAVENLADKWDKDHKGRTMISNEDFIHQEGIQAFIGVSLQTGEQTLGVLFINYRQPRSFSESDIQIIGTFAAQAAVAMQAGQLYTKTRQLSHTRRTALQGLTQIQALLSRGAHQQQKTYQALIETAVAVTPAKYGTFFRVDEKSGEILPIAQGDPYERQRIVAPKPGETGVTGWVAKYKRTARVRDVNKAPWREWYKRLLEDTHSELSVPILSGSRKLVGIIDLESDKLDAFSDQDQEVVEALATAAAVSFRSAELYDQIAKRQKHSQALVRAARSLSTSLDRKIILDNILESAVSLSGESGSRADLGMILLYDPPTNCLEYYNVYPKIYYRDLRSKIGARIPLPDVVTQPYGNSKIGISGRVFLSGKSELVLNVSQDVDYIPYLPDIHTALAVPLKIGNRKAGVLIIESKSLNAFTQVDKEVLDQLAEHAALAIKNSETYAELDTKKSELAASTTVAWAGVLGSSLYHDVKGYAAAIRNDVQEIQSLRPDLTEQASTAEPLSEILISAERILSGTEHLRLAPEEQVDRVSFSELLTERLNRWKKLYHSAQIEWEIEGFNLSISTRVRVNRLALVTALDKLVDNAVNILQGRTDKKISFRLSIDSHKIYLDISDNGPAIDENTVNKLFYNRIIKAPGEKGSGMGLMIAKMIMVASRGDIYLQQNLPGQVTFRLWLPLEEENG